MSQELKGISTKETKYILGGMKEDLNQLRVYVLEKRGAKE